jgi:hypothetical protein
MNDETFSLSYTLSAPDLEDPLNEGEFNSLDRARDIAFEISLEYAVPVRITEHFGASSNLIEIVEA